MKTSTKWIIAIVAIATGGLYGYVQYKKSNKYMSKRLQELGLTKTDVSKLDSEFLKTWLSQAESEKGAFKDYSYFVYKDTLYKLFGGKKIAESEIIRNGPINL